MGRRGSAIHAFQAYYSLSFFISYNTLFTLVPVNMQDVYQLRTLYITA